MALLIFEVILLAMIALSLLIYGAVHSCGSLQVVEKPIVLAEDLYINIISNKIYFSLANKENGALLKGLLGVSLPEDSKSPRLRCDDSDNCLQFGHDLKMTATKIDKCYHIHWTGTEHDSFQDCFDYEDDKWFGGPQNIQQYWPFNNMTFRDFSYITKMEQNQGVAEPYWLTSSGYYIYVNKITPLFIDSNNIRKNSLCLIAKQTPPYSARDQTKLQYKICAYNNIRRAHIHAIKHDLGHPTDIPDQRMVQHPIWSTWVRFKYNVNDSSVRGFADDIVKNGFYNSQLEIDDNWETCYGSAKFNKSRFHDMPKLGLDLKNMDFRVTIWNHPFINTDCDIFNEIRDKGYLVKNKNGNVVSSWWDGEAGVVDFTNPDAANWFLDRHRKMLKHNNIDSVKMDAGETSWLPQIPSLNADIKEQPDAYTEAYVRTVAQFGPMIEVRTGHLTQDLPIFLRMLDKDSKWTFENGLPTLLTTLFQLNLNGYPFVLPDMVGGNAYGEDVVTKELFIRWLQANTFMPSIQFSIAPWDFDHETVEISKKFTALHYKYSDMIISQMQRSVKTGAPVNMPIWWVAPTDTVAHSIWSEYMLGEHILVAPVLEEGVYYRDIYLPKGKWRDETDPTHKDYDGPQWLQSYPAPLDTLPYFTRISKFDDDDEDFN